MRFCSFVVYVVEGESLHLKAGFGSYSCAGSRCVTEKPFWTRLQGLNLRMRPGLCTFLLYFFMKAAAPGAAQGTNAAMQKQAWSTGVWCGTRLSLWAVA